MPIFKLTAEFARITAIPADAVQHTWHWESVLPTPDFTDVTGYMNRFYGTDTEPGESISRLLGSVLSGDVRYTFFPAAGGDAVFTIATSFANMGSSSMPAEVAVALSYHQFPFDPTIAAARQRGRVFLGPLDVGVFAVAAGDSRPIASATETMRLALVRLLADSDADVDWTWVVYSRAQAAAALQASFPVGAGWVDNAADTQRRRGAQADVRELWPA